MLTEDSHFGVANLDRSLILDQLPYPLPFQSSFKSSPTVFLFQKLLIRGSPLLALEWVTILKAFFRLLRYSVSGSPTCSD